jgi:polyketide cyclase/dehydrase/lipid transport protein
MKVLKFVLIGIGVVVVLILVAAIFITKTYHVERSVSIHAPQPLVMEQVKSLKKMNEWSPFVEQDPQMQIIYSGTEGQVGSSSYWKSDKAGEGSQTITKLTNDRMETKLLFKEPMEGEAMAFFQTQDEGGDVKATWSMEGKSPYPFNVMCLFMDNMIGKEYEKGLAKLKVRCEEMAKGVSN